MATRCELGSEDIFASALAGEAIACTALLAFKAEVTGEGGGRCKWATTVGRARRPGLRGRGGFDTAQGGIVVGMRQLSAVETESELVGPWRACGKRGRAHGRTGGRGSGVVR
jgi:hypothetical protein